MRLPPLNGFRLLPLELAVSGATIVLTLGVLASYQQVTHEKARLTEVLLHLSAARGAVIERLATEGHIEELEQTDDEAEISGRFTYQRVGAHIVAWGTLDQHETAIDADIQLAFTPATSNTGEGWSVLWLCGQRRPPPGWSAPAPVPVENLTPEQIPHVCRDLRAP